MLAAVALLGLYYLEEDCRGWCQWRLCKRQLEAQGAALDWLAFRPAKVADEENILKAPRMADWFSAKSPNDLTEKLSSAGLVTVARSLDSNVLAQVYQTDPDDPVPEGNVDVLLSYRDGTLKLSPFGGNERDHSAADFQVIPLIVYDGVPLTDAIMNLARQGEITCEIDADLEIKPGGPPMVTFRWENLSAQQTLTALLTNYALEMVSLHSNRTFRIRRAAEPGGPKVQVETAAQERLEGAILAAWKAAGNQMPIQGLMGSQDYFLVARELKPVHPIQVAVRTERWWPASTVSQFFPIQLLPTSRSRLAALRVQPGNSGSFNLLLGPPHYYLAADYLAWSDPVRAEFDTIRSGLKRACAQAGTDCEEAGPPQIYDYVTVRVLIQTLAQRAQCHLLLNESEAALQELTLVHEVCRLLKRRPVTIVPAMMDVAVNGVYVGVVADGLRLGAWREPQLKIVQQQLDEVDLLPLLVEAAQWERYHLCRAIESEPLPKLMRSMKFVGMPPPQPSLETKDLVYGLYSLAPRGWAYQAMATVARLDQDLLDSVDGTSRVVYPEKMEDAESAAQALLQRTGPTTFLASTIHPSFTHAWAVMARNQTLANHALIACALERYRLAHSRYPDRLEQLVPSFATRIPRDVIHGEPLRYRLEENGRFLLYSVGWNGKDDGGTPEPSEAYLPDQPRCDWVWGESIRSKEHSHGATELSLSK